ncbi:FapA family protein [Ruminococcaceae bacterium OttesenSCG-928-L11]|nr:FapA family protein [Ruminococcaceae bacterium OttesenSCG-928-L11]
MALENDNRLGEELEQEILPPQKPIIVLKASSNFQEAELLIQRPEGDVLPLLAEDIEAALAAENITTGIDKAVIQAVCAHTEYNAPRIVARGKYPETGRDGYVDYHVTVDRNTRPKIREDGTVDYRDLGLIENVTAEQVLCDIHPPEKGEDGFDILGNVLEGKMGREAPNVAGQNTHYSEDKQQLLADVDGNAEVNKGVVSVQTVMTVKGNVDNSTGDINFVGNVVVSGDILSGFKVISGGTITVKGIVEGATLEAGGDIIVNDGINGMNRGSLTAGGDIKCRFIQGCFLKAGGNIFSDSIMHCNIECHGNLELNGKRGTLIGGRSTVSNALICKTIGTDSHLATQVIMQNLDTSLADEKLALQSKIKEIQAEDLKLEQIMNRVTELIQKGKADPQMKQTILIANNNRIKLKGDLQATKTRLAEVEKEQIRQNMENNCYIEAKGRIHAGVQLSFGPLNMNVQQSFVFSRVSIVQGEITISPLS